jgi:acetyl-CoA synthetase
MDVLMPTWFHGMPVLAFRSVGFDPEEAFHMMAKHEVTNALLVPTMIRLMKQVPNPRARYDLTLRSLISGGEAVGAEIIEWTHETLNVRINEVFGQTECNLALGHNAALMPAKPGSLGQPIPGHIGAVVDPDGNELPAGQVGQIAFQRPDPVMLLEYWKNPQATADKFVGDWLLTGDLGQRDDDGYFWYRGRADDVITSAGYRIGPGEIEEALLRHPSVRLAAAIGVPDPVRTESIKAFVVLADDHQPTEALEREIREFVKSRLARHEYPRAIEFLDSLPTTTTGKIMRRELREREQAKMRAAQ